MQLQVVIPKLYYLPAQRQLAKLSSLQNCAVPILTHSSYDADANQLLKELGWDNLEASCQKLKAEMFCKSLNGLAPNNIICL